MFEFDFSWRDLPEADDDMCILLELQKLPPKRLAMLLVFHDSDASYSPIIAFCLLVFNSGDAFKILLVKLSSPRFFLGMTRNLEGRE